MRTTTAIFTIMFALGGGSCVTARNYDRKVVELNQEKCSSAARERAAAAQAQERAAEIDRLNRERAQLAASLGGTRQSLEDSRREAAAAEERAQLYRTLVQRLQGMIDAGKLTVVLRDGRMLIALPTDILFDSGRTRVKRRERATLIEVAAVLREIKDRRFLIVGHTDDVPIHTTRFPSNWQLSAGRAIAVADLLMDNGIPAQGLGIGGQGEFDPVAPNDSDENRARNRRIEIVLEPNLTALATVDVKPAVSLRAPSGR